MNVKVPLVRRSDTVALDALLLLAGGARRKPGFQSY